MAGPDHLKVQLATTQVPLEISASSLPLPTGASTAAAQSTGNTSLASIDGKLGTIGQQAMAGSTPVVIASNQSALKIDGSAVTQPISGTITANAGTGPFPVSDNAGSLTVDAPVGTPVAARLSDGTAFYNAPTSGQLPAALVGDRLDVVVGAALPAGTANIGDVDVLTLPSGTVAGAASLPAGSNNIGDVDVLTLPALVAGTANIGDVDVLTLPSGTVAGAASLPAGSNNIGDVDVLSLPALVAGTANIGDVDVASIAAGTTRIGAVYDTGGTILDEVPTARGVNRDFVTATASGNTQVVAAQGAGVRIRVLAVFSVANAAVSVKFQSGTTDITALFSLAANGGFVLPYNPHGWFQTAANAALNVNLSAAVSTGVQVIWVQAT